MINPFDSEKAQLQSCYTAFTDKKLVWADDKKGTVPELADFVHYSFRSLILNPKFTCPGAKSAFNRNTYRFGLYDEMVFSTEGLARDLFSFVQEQKQLGGNFTTFVASFNNPQALTEENFETLLWQQLQALSDIDVNPWDEKVSSNPEDKTFAFSFAGRAFFVVGIHPSASRFSRRFAYPTLVFNAHYQFDNLKEQGLYNPIKNTVDEREKSLQGETNPMLEKFGDASEAKQYSGRAIEKDWKCPFHKE